MEQRRIVLTEYEKRQEQRIKDLEQMVILLNDEIKALQEILNRPL